MRYLLFSLFILLGLTACQDSDKSVDMETVNPDNIYFDYRVTAEEGKDMAAVMLQYRLEDQEGPALMLQKPGKVTFDGVELQPDSARLSGTFYEVIKSVDDFKGVHTIVFTDFRGKQHKEEFEFVPFTFRDELPGNVKRQPFTIQLKGLTDKANIRLVMTDTAFESPDVNEIFTIYKGQVPIDDGMLQNLQNGPISLEIFAEEGRRLANTTKAGGRLLLTYGLKRQFELVD